MAGREGELGSSKLFSIEETKLIDDTIHGLEALMDDIKRAAQCGHDVSECEMARRELVKTLRAYKRFFGTTPERKGKIGDKSE